MFPATQRIAGVATLTITSAIAQKVLQIDLDRNLPVTAVSIDGKALTPQE